MKDHVTPNLLKLARLFKKKGELYIVGGYVRNALLGIYETDIDLASRLTNEEIKEILSDTKYEVKENSKKLGTLTISLGEEKWEHATFRKEEYREGGEHTPIKITFIDDIREDAKRRDFTINCVYYNILKDEYIDFYGGIEDIKKRIIRTIETPKYVFSSDGLRILRMARLASELNFKISSDTLLMAYNMRENVGDISSARKFEELILILNSPRRYKISKTNSYMIGLKVYNSLKLWKYYNCPVLKVWYYLVKKVNSEARLYALLIDIISTSKLISDNDELVSQILGRYGLNISENKISKYNHIIKAYFDALNKMENKEFFIKYYDDFKLISELLKCKSKSIYNKYNFFYNYLNNNKVPIRLKDLKLSGADIKQNYPKIKEKYYNLILTELLSRVFDGSIKNEKETLLKEVAKVKV